MRSSVGGGVDSTVSMGNLLDDLIVGDTATNHVDDSGKSSPATNGQILADELSMHTTEMPTPRGKVPLAWAIH